MPISVASPLRVPRLGLCLGALVRAALALEGRAPGEIAVVLGSDSLLRDLNRRYRSLDRSTDVLSFAYPSPPAGARPGRVDGDIIVSLERVAEQARRYRVSRGRELARLVVHGALHLAGLDHDRTAARRHMRRREGEALRKAAATVTRLERALAKVDRTGKVRTHSPS